MVKIISAEGVVNDISCIGCALNLGKIQNIGEVVKETKYFFVRQDYEIPIPGFMVVSSKRHIVGIGDFTKAEEKEFIMLLCQLRRVVGDLIGIKYFDMLYSETTFESKINPSHFHIALLPRYSWMKGKNYKQIFEYAKNKMRNKKCLSKVKIIAKKTRVSL
jgi:diadenosine tetraphosphate (Ap4A) HIT family hydrolase